MPDAHTQDVKAIARYVRVSPQKARLVVDLIRGRRAAEALEMLRFTRKRIAADVAKLLQSAIANATDRGELDVDALYVTRAFVNDGPRQKRIRPAPMGRAYRYQRRSSHIEVHVGERGGAAALTRRVVEPAAPAAAAPAAARKAPARKPAAKKTAARKPAAKKPASRKPGAGGAKKPAGKKPAAKQPKGGE
ncbi:MAG TPA: 50S ribosomal protein L22 [Terriglobales bacterium]|nr:50S ribosomal protein L22 [Terriglobales bacterium]